MSKIYFHRFAGAKFFMPKGEEIAFAGGAFDSAAIKDDELRAQVEKELDKIANSPASMVYTKEAQEDMSERQVNAELMETAETQFDDVNKMKPGSKTVPMPKMQEGRPVIPGSGAQNKGADSMDSRIAAAKAAVATAKPNNAV